MSVLLKNCHLSITASERDYLTKVIVTVAKPQVTEQIDFLN